jgi:hypothetical protein
MFSKRRFPNNLGLSASAAAERTWNMRVDPVNAAALPEDAAP